MNQTLKIIISVILVAIALVSFFPAAKTASSPETYSRTFQTLDDKRGDVLKLTAATTATTVALSMLPGDMGTPIATELADFGDYFLLILGVLFAEKFMLTITGAVSFRFLLPFACVLFIAGIWTGNGTFKRISAKFALLAVALLCIIPLSMRASNMVDSIYKSTIENTISTVQEFENDAAEASGLKNIISGTFTELKEKAQSTVNSFLESIAVLIVTSCVIPIFGAVIVIWVIRKLTGKEFLPFSRIRNRRREHACDSN